MAYEKYKKSLEITQQIGDIEGEAATFHQLGLLSWSRSHTDNGLRMIALSYLISLSIGHEKSQLSFENLKVMASQLKHTQESFDAMLKEVAESYRKDRGQSLINAAFQKS